VWQNVLTYVQVLQTNGDMRVLMLSTAAAEMLGFSHQVMLPILARDVLHVGAAGLGVLTAFRFLGGVLGVGLLTALGEVPHRGRLLLVVLSLFGAGQVLLSQAPYFWLAVACVTFINVMASATDILHHTLLQLSVANEQRGRAMGSWIVATGTGPIGHLQIGYLASLTSASFALLIHGIALTLLPVGIALLLPRLRRL
jgi:predicted MFS family arabinose efflux permease